MANGKLNLGKQSGGVLSLAFPDGVTNTEVVLPESGTVASVDGAVTDNAVPRYDGTTGKLQNSGVVIDDSGNVGVGISIPLSPLHVCKVNSNDTVENRIQISRYPDGRGTSLMQSYRSDTNSDELMIAVDSVNSNDLTKTKYRISSKGEHKFYGPTTATEKMKIDLSGNVLLTSGTGGLGYGTGAGGSVTQLTSKSTAVTLNKPSGLITMNNAALASGATVSFTVNNSLVGPNDQVVPKVGQGSYLYSVLVTSVGTGSFVVYLKNESADSRSENVNISFAIIKGSNT